MKLIDYLKYHYNSETIHSMNGFLKQSIIRINIEIDYFNNQLRFEPRKSRSPYPFSKNDEKNPFKTVYGESPNKSNYKKYSK